MENLDLEKFLSFSEGSDHDTPPNDPVDPDTDPTPDPTPDPEPIPDSPTPKAPGNADPIPVEDDFFSTLKERGIIDVDDDFEYDGSDEALERALETTSTKKLEKAKEHILGSLPEDFKPLLEYALNGGNSLQKYLDTFAVPSLEDIDITDEAQQEHLLELYYKETSNYSEPKIRKLIDRLRASGDLAEAAEESLVELQEERNRKKEEFVETQRAEQAKQQEKIRESAANFKTAIDSYKTTPARKEQIKGMFQAPAGQAPNFSVTFEKIKSNYDHLLQLTDLFIDYDEKKGFDFERLKRQTSSDGARGLRSILEQKTSGAKSKTSGASVPANDENFNWEAFLGLSK
jgi:hypothetical protein